MRRQRGSRSEGMDSSKMDTAEAAPTVDEVERLRRDLHHEKQQSLRVRADYDNLRKRAEKKVSMELEA